MTDKPPGGDDLRAEAKRRLDENKPDLKTPLNDPESIIEELRIHQAELEIQNEALNNLTDELRRTRDEYINLYNRSPVGYVTLSEGHIIERINQRALDMLQTTQQVVIGERFTTLVAPAYQDAVYKHLRATFKDGDSQHEVEVDLLDEQGQPVPVRLISQSAPEGVRITITDLSRLRQSEEKNERRLAFFAMVSHELRNPLTIIKNSAETLRSLRTVWESAMRDELLAYIMDEVENLRELLTQFLDISRMELGVFHIHPETVRLTSFIEEINHRLEQISADHQLTMTMPEDTTVTLNIDKRRVNQVLLNIVQNAVKYTEAGTPIHVKVAPQGEMVQFTVEDEGPGIPPEQRPYVFEAFTQGEDKLTTGAGLGLTICKGIVEAHEGRIWLEERSEGTAFSFTVPGRASRGGTLP